MDDKNKMTNVEPEYITIVEGPEPEFSSHNDIWALSVLEGAKHLGIEQCRLRTFNGESLVERCRNAWADQRPVLLDYPNRIGLRRQVKILAARATEVAEGQMLLLWVRSPQEAEELDDLG